MSERSIPQVREERQEGKAPPSLQSLNEIIRQIFTALNRLVGRAGEIQLLNSVNINSFLTLQGLETEPDVAPPDCARLYFNAVTGKLRLSENEGAYVNVV